MFGSMVLYVMDFDGLGFPLLALSVFHLKPYAITVLHHLMGFVFFAFRQIKLGTGYTMPHCKTWRTV